MTYRNNRKPKTGLNVIAAFVILITVLGWLTVRTIVRENHVDFQLKAYAPTRAYAYTAPSPTPTPDEHSEIVSYITQTFGKDAPKAFELLEKCGENASLNPKAENDNTTWGGVGRDWGVFQINDKWQGVSNVAFLTDWKINIDMAYNIFTRDGHSFKLWTGGRKCSI